MTESTLPTVDAALDENKIIAERREKLRALREAGIAYPNDFTPTHHAGDLQTQHADTDKDALEAAALQVAVAGRMMLKRVMGKASFATVRDGSGQIQFFVTPADVGEQTYEAFKKWDLGDIVAARGVLFRTNCSACHNFTGEGGALAYGKEAPSLHKASDKQIYEAMVTGPGTMPVFSDRQLTPDEKKDVIAFVQGMKTTPDPGGFNLGRQGAVAEGLIAFLAGMVVLTGVAVWIGTRARKAA